MESIAENLDTNLIQVPAEVQQNLQQISKQLHDLQATANLIISTFLATKGIPSTYALNFNDDFSALRLESFDPVEPITVEQTNNDNKE